MRLGISSYTYVWSVGVAGFPAPETPMSATELLRRCANLDVHVLQIADNLPLHEYDDRQLSELKTAASRYVVDIEVGARGIEQRHLFKYLQLAVRLSSPIVRVVIDLESPDSDPNPNTRGPSIDEVVNTISSVVRDFEKENVKLALENHDRFSADTLLTMIERIGSDHVGICFDTANSIGCLESPELVLETLGPHILNLHIKDYCIFRPPHNKGFVVEGRPAGQGQLDIPRLLQRLHEFGQDVNAILELWPPPQESIDVSIQLEENWAKSSVAYLRTLIPE